jgi:hypothetical protein
MKAISNGTYPKRNQVTGVVTDVFVYNVHGTEEELQAFKDAQGANYRVDSKTNEPLFFSPRYVGEEVTIIITSNGRAVADTSALTKAKSMASQYDFMADHIAKAIVDSMGFGNFGKHTSQPKAVTAPAVQEPVASVGDSGVVEGIDPFKD